MKGVSMRDRHCGPSSAGDLARQSRKSETRPAARATYDRETARLLRALGAAGAYAFEVGADEPGRVAVASGAGGVSLRRLSAPLAAAEALVAADLAAWESPGRSRRRRLVVTPAGLAHLARQAAPAELDAFTAQHAVLERATVAAPEGGRHEVALNVAESPLAWLARRRDKTGRALIDAAALQAGERLRSDLTLAHMLPHVTLNWTGIAVGATGSAALHYSDLVVAARQRVDRAFDAVGNEMAGLLMDVCGFLKGIEQVERERGWPARSGKVVLVMALARLAAHYGLSAEARGQARGRRIRAWSQENGMSAIG
jgi:Domain of unknown function (DUF6456)